MAIKCKYINILYHLKNKKIHLNDKNKFEKRIIIIKNVVSIKI